MIGALKNIGRRKRLKVTKSDTVDINEQPKKFGNNTIKRIFWIILGSGFVAVAFVAAFVPGLPSTPFALLAAYCYARSSQRIYQWFITNKLFGKIIRDYRDHKGMTIRLKIVVCIMITTFTTLGIVFGLEYLWFRLLLGLLGLTGVLYVAFRVPNNRPTKTDN